MNILIIGQGGREHALAWHCARAPYVKQVFVAPGNAGTNHENKVSNIDIDVLHFEKLVQFAKTQPIDLTIVGPEAPLAAGIVDYFQQQKLLCFGPSQKAAQLEASKAFSKHFMAKYQIPTAKFKNFTQPELAKDYVREQGTPIVIKADGLAAGKGVVVAFNELEAFNAIDEMLSKKQFGQAGQQIVIEEYLQGEEASFIVITDGKHFIPLAPAQDHKRLGEQNTGPNTGGMGAFSPTSVITPQLEKSIIKTVIEPTLVGLRQENIPFTGFLYAGLMITAKQEPKVLEFNCRLGDPEAQVILMRLQTDLVQCCLKALKKELHDTYLTWDPRAALGVMLAANGYPGEYQKGLPIEGIDEKFADNIKIFHSGTKKIDHQVVTNGGRVLCVTALADSLLDAHNQVYRAIKNISWQGMYYRKDIGAL